MKWKFLPLFFLFGFLFLIPQSSSIVTVSDSPYISVDSGLGLGTYGSYYVLIDLSTGWINSTWISLDVYDTYGEFRFQSNASGTFHFSDPAADYDLSASGGTITIDEATGHIDDTYAANTLVVLSWSSPLTPTLPLMFILGMVGLGSMMGGSMFTVYQLKQGEYLDAIKTGVVFFFIGLGLFMAWLIA